MKCTKECPSKEVLVDLYITRDFGLVRMGKELGVSKNVVRRWLTQNGIEIKKTFFSESKLFYDGANKECSTCHKIKKVEDFPKNDYFITTGIDSECCECSSKRYKDWLHNDGNYEDRQKKLHDYNQIPVNKTRNRIRNTGERMRNIDLLKKLKEELGCQICGENRTACLEFHHLKPATKYPNYRGAVNHYLPNRKRLLDELSRCCIICANCHSLVHHGEVKQELTPLDVEKYREQ